MKKKAEFSTLADEVDSLKKENKELNKKVSTFWQVSAIKDENLISFYSFI